MADPRFAHLSREQVEEAADALFDGLHRIVFELDISGRRSFEAARGVAVEHIKAAHALGFDPLDVPRG